MDDEFVKLMLSQVEEPRYSLPALKFREEVRLWPPPIVCDPVSDEVLRELFQRVGTDLQGG